jgi:hypothetical protein
VLQVFIITKHKLTSGRACACVQVCLFGQRTDCRLNALTDHWSVIYDDWDSRGACRHALALSSHASVSSMCVKPKHVCTHFSIVNVDWLVQHQRNPLVHGNFCTCYKNWNILEVWTIIYSFYSRRITRTTKPILGGIAFYFRRRSKNFGASPKYLLSSSNNQSILGGSPIIKLVPPN